MQISKQRIIDVLKQVIPDDDAQEIIFYLRGKSNISEFIIAEELDLEIHRTRNLLYKLLDSNLVTFKRKKDKIKGWYICYWDFNESNVIHLEEKFKRETIEKIKQRLENETSGFFYMCRYAHARQGFDIAFENNFKCPECGELMNQVDNTRTIEFLQKRLAELTETQQEPREKKSTPVKKTVKKVAVKKPAVKKATVRKTTKKKAVKTAKTKKAAPSKKKKIVKKKVRA
jgi:transcription initiation factor TFIIE subunit alpha